jgi:hypothetical protein
MEGIFRIIRLLIDPKSARDLEKDGQKALDKGTDPKKPTQNLKVVENAMARVKKAAVALGGAILAAFSVRKIQSFVQSAIDASFALEASRNRLAVALRNEGIELSAVNSELQEFTRNLWETHRLTEGAAIPILQQLITITGDYDKSLRGVGIAANLSAASGMDMISAARMIGQAMNGEVGRIQRYVGEIEDGADAIAIMEEKLADMRKNAIPATAELGMQMGELKEAIGFAVRESLDFDSRVEVLTGRIEGLAKNTELIGRLVRELYRAMRDVVNIIIVLAGAKGFLALRGAMLAAGGGVGFVNAKLTLLIAKLNAVRVAMGPVGWFTLAISVGITVLNRWRDAAREAERALSDLLERRRAALLSENLESVATALREAQENVAKLGRDIEEARKYDAGGVVARLEADLEREQDAVRKLGLEYVRLAALRMGRDPEETGAAGESAATGEAAAAGRDRTIGPVRLRALAGLGNAQVLEERHAAFVASLTQINLDGFNQQIADALAAQQAAKDAMRAQAEETVTALLAEFQPFFDGMAMGFLGIQGAAEQMLDGLRGVGALVVQELIAGKAEMSMAEAISDLASGTWPPNPLALKAAALHMSAAAAYRAIKGSGRGGSSASRSIGNPMAATRPSAMAERMLPEINIYIDPLNPTNPAWQSTLAQTLRGVRQRYGSATVNVRPRTA